MKTRTSVSALLALAWLAACESQPPSDVQSSTSASPDLLAVNPNDIAILPIEDATPERRLAVHLDFIRAEIARALVRQFYSPLSARAVDGPLAADASALGKHGGVTTPATLQRVAGKFGEDAVLGVRIDSWDESSLMADNRLRFSADVALLDSKGKKMLWSGHVSGQVKAGGFGPAPLDRDEKARSAAAEFAGVVIGRLPQRAR